MSHTRIESRLKALEAVNAKGVVGVVTSGTGDPAEQERIRQRVAELRRAGHTVYIAHIPNRRRAFDV